jgi:hypothetical protein
MQKSGRERFEPKDVAKATNIYYKTVGGILIYTEGVIHKKISKRINFWGFTGEPISVLPPMRLR